MHFIGLYKELMERIKMKDLYGTYRPYGVWF